MGLSREAYDGTIKKLERCVLTAKKNLMNGTTDESVEMAKTFTVYGGCEYCVRYRATLDARGFKGACRGCPLQGHGERLAGRPLSYNGCYQIPVYRNIVKTCTWFLSDTSHCVLVVLLNHLEAGLAHFRLLERSLVLS